MLELREGPEGTTIRVKVRPGARRDQIAGEHGGALKIHVTAPPEKGKANAAVAELLAKSLGIRAADLVLVGGAASTEKCFRARGVSKQHIERILAEFVSPSGYRRAGSNG